MAERKSVHEGHATFVESEIQRIEKAADQQIRRIEKASVATVQKAEETAPVEALEELLQKTERMADQLGDLVIFRKIRRMGKYSKRFFVLIVASGVVLYWLGMWNLVDLFWEYVLPNNRITAAFISMLVGAVILVGTGKLIDALGVEAEFEAGAFAKPPRTPPLDEPEKKS